MAAKYFKNLMKQEIVRIVVVQLKVKLSNAASIGNKNLKIRNAVKIFKIQHWFIYLISNTCISIH